MGTSTAEKLQAAWCQGVCRDHGAGAFHYEEDLQASLYYHLRALLGNSYVVHVNALKHHSYLNRKSPDVIVVRNGHIKFLIELKYAPLQQITEEDLYLAGINKLKAISKVAVGGYPFSLGRSGKTALLDENTQYALGIVADTDQVALEEFQHTIKNELRSLASNFYLLYNIGEEFGFKCLKSI